MKFVKAEKAKSKLKLGLAGVAGSGKTYSGNILAKALGKKVAVVDSENGSASLYSDDKVSNALRNVFVRRPPARVVDGICSECPPFLSSQNAARRSIFR